MMRFAKALYLKRYRGFESLPHRAILAPFQLEASSLGESAAINRKRSLTKHDEGQGMKERDFLTRND